MFYTPITYYDAIQIPITQCGQEPDGEGDGAGGYQNVGDVVHKHVKGVLKDLLPGRVNQPRRTSRCETRCHDLIINLVVLLSSIHLKWKNMEPCERHVIHAWTYNVSTVSIKR